MPATLLKSDSNAGVFGETSETFKSTLSYGISEVAASDIW